MGSRSPKSNQFLPLSQQYSCTSLVKIHPFILEIGCRKAIFQQSEPSYDFEKGSRSPKSNQFFFMSQQCSCASLVKIHPFLHEIGCRQAILQKSKLSPCVILKMRSRSPKPNQFFSMSQQYRCTSPVKTYPLILEIGCRQAIFQQSEPSCDLKNGVKVINI